MIGEQKKLDSLISSGNFLIPPYQRAYEWRLSNFEDFIEDISHYEKYRELGFIGTIILRDCGDRKWEIVDGQQRITSLLLFTIALTKRLIELHEKKGEGISSGSVRRSIQRYENLYIDRFEEPRLIAHEKIRESFNEICSIENSHIDRNIFKNKNSITQAYLAFEEQANKCKSIKEVENMLNVIFDLDVMTITVKKEEEAFHIFETTNARGKELEVGDLLRNHIFSNVPEKDRSQVKERWDSIIDKACGQSVAMLRQYYFTKQGYISKKLLYKEIKKLNIDAKKLLNEIEEYVTFFEIVKRGTKEDFASYIFEIFHGRRFDGEDLQKMFISISALRDFNQIQPFPVLYSFLKAFKKITSNETRINKKNVTTFITNIEKFHYVNYKIGSNRANKVENLYAITANDLLKSNKKESFKKKIENFYKKLSDLLDPLEVFEAKFVEITYKNKRDIRYIFSTLDTYLKSKHKEGISDIYNPEEALSPSLDNIEHWAPQNFSNKNDEYYGIWESLSDEVINNIGNLFVMYSRKNSQLQNKSPMEKYKICQSISTTTPSSRVFNDFIKKYSSDFESWDEKAINKRAKDLATLSYDKLWKLELKFWI